MKMPWQAQPISGGVTKWILILGFTAFAALYIWGRMYDSVEVELGGERFVARIADTVDKRAKGLGGSDPLGQHEAMIFVFGASESHTFWMKGLTYPLDIIWFNEGKIVDIAPRVPPTNPEDPESSYPRYAPRFDAKYVIEVPSGTADRLKLKIGDPVKVILEE
jgi:uncharacterized membrane protein (UPF0127 family)